MSQLPLVSIVIPARNEHRDIEGCLDAVIAQDWPDDRMEVVVVDGDSSDATAELAEGRLASTYLEWRVIRSPEASTPRNLNRGLAAANGEILCRVDARSRIPPTYVRRCAEVLSSRPGVTVVGGRQVAAAAREDHIIERAIAVALNSSWSNGGAVYRRQAPRSGPAETVYLGAFRTRDLRDVGGWDPRLATNQDYELNRRLGAKGSVWVVGDLGVQYIPRPTLRALWAQYRRFGRWKASVWRSDVVRASRRQRVLVAIPPAGTFMAIGVLRSRWRRPAVAAGACVGVGITAVRSRNGGALLGVLSLVASTVIVTAWWVGVVEQMVRESVTGESLVR